jgi:hypothetical protein
MNRSQQEGRDSGFDCENLSNTALSFDSHFTMTGEQFVTCGIICTILLFFASICPLPGLVV